MSIHCEFPWVLLIPLDSNENGNRQASFMRMEIGIGIAWREWEGIKTPDFPISCPQVVDHQKLLIDSCFCIVILICRRLLGLVSLWMSMRHCLLWYCLCIFEDLLAFFAFYNSIVLCIVKFTGYLLSHEILLAVREWEREGIGITNGNGKGMGIKPG